MIVCLTYVNPINNQQENLNLDYPMIDYMTFKRIREYNNDFDLIIILDDIIKELDCTIEYDCGRPKVTTFPIYNMTLSKYYFYLSRITNQFIYNKYIDKVIKRHIDNLVFEYKHPYIPPTNKKKVTSKKKKLPPNQFFKQVTYDLFTNKETYIYINPRTKEEINSDNPNLLDELNTPKKKERKSSIKIKQTGVPISAMTFSFKKK